MRVVAAGRSFYRTFRLASDDVRGRPLYEIDGGQWDIPELRRLLENISKDQISIDGYEVDHEFPAIGRRVMVLNARKVFYEKGSRATVLLAFEDITGRRVVEQQIQTLLREKEMLLEEMQHRVANSLQIIASILLIKARTFQSGETRLQVEDAHPRVLSVAAVQQHLHLSGPNRPISLKVEADPGTAASREAVSIGLIVTELVTNALKHAFPDERRDGAIVVLYKVAETDWKLTASDNGVGKPDVRAGDGKAGLGTSLIQALAKQLDARLATASDSSGTAVSVAHATFKAKPTAATEGTPFLTNGATGGSQ